ncbi:MAG TPA: YciI family protein [Terriglobales bacterium]|nr:YciI family protein [Terriglobales bacterium]
MDTGESEGAREIAENAAQVALRHLSISSRSHVITAGESMQYLLLIYHAESDWEKLGPAQQASIYQEYRELIQHLAEAGKYVAGDELKPTTTATTVRVRDGRQSITDGPFAETKEQLGGYFLVNASDLDEAIAIAAQIPTVRDGSIEIRPVAVQEQARQAS